MDEDKESSQSTKLLTLKGFKIQNKIGSGSYATVYKAHTDNEQHTEVAIKCIDRTKVSKRMFDSIVNEIKVLKLLHHEHIVSMLDFLWDDRYVYIVLEYCEGGDLSTYIKARHKISEFQCQIFMRQLVLALKFLRENNVCHLDLKPQNVLIKNNKLKLADFGFAQILSPEDHGASMRGSPLYMAPEVLTGSSYDGTADLWSLGVLMYEALFGHAPYSHCSLAQIRTQALSPTPIKLPPSSLSMECVYLLSRLLQKDPMLRLSHEELYVDPFTDLAHYPCATSFQKAVRTGSQAVSQDKGGHYNDAFRLYCEALSYLKPLAYMETDATKKTALQDKIDKYKKRAEELRSSLVGEHKPAVEVHHAETSASPTTLSSLRALAQSRPQLKSALEIGEAGDMYLNEGNYAVALDKFKSCLSVLMPMCDETSCTKLKTLLGTQIKEWLSTAEHLQSILEASRSEQDPPTGSPVKGKCCMQ